MTVTVRYLGLLPLLFLWTASIASSQVTVRGTVIEEDSHIPLPGTSVTIRGTTIGTTTDSDGNYTLEVPSSDVTLVFRFTGFQTYESALPPNTEELNVTLTPAIFGLNEVVVVGSRRQPRLLKDSAVPVDVLGVSNLQSLGTTDVDLVLRSQIPSYNLQSYTGDEAAIVRPATLRGLPTDNVIVLVNGKRRHRSASIALSGSSLNKGAQGPDLNMIPTIALNQLEILRDGATAQYGADAVAGVLNLQLRENRDGVRSLLRTGQYSKGDGRYIHLASNAGFSLPGEGGFLNLSVEYRDVQATVRSTQREDAQILTERGYPVKNPAQIWGSPDVSHSITGFFNSGMNLTPTIRAYAFGGGGRRTQEYGFFFRAPGTETARSSVFRFGNERAVIDLNPDQGPDCKNDDRLPGLNASNQEVQSFISDFQGECYLFNEMFPGGFTPRFGGDVFDLSLTTGLRGGRQDGLNWDVTLSGARSLIDYFLYNSINASLGPDTPNSFKPRSYFQQEAEVSAAFSIPLSIRQFSSPINLAWGATWRTEIFESRAGDSPSWQVGPYVDQGFSVGANGYQGLNPIFAGRWARPNIAFHIDVEADLTQRLLGNIAARYENYTTDFGGTLNGKAALLYRATDKISLRGAASTGFRAPTPGQANLNVFRTTGFSKEKGLIEVGVIPSTHPIAVALGGDPLTPELARNLSIGVIIEFQEGLTLTADFFNIELEDRLSLTGNIPITDEIVQIIDSKNLLGGITNIREVRFYSNDFNTRTNGLDVLLAGDHEWSRTHASFGSIAWNWTTTSLTHFTAPRQITSFLDEPLETPLTLSLLTRQRRVELERLNPRHRVVATYRQMVNHWSGLLRVNWFGSWQQCRYGSSTCRADGIDVQEEFPSSWIVDAEIGYAANDSWTVIFGMSNIFDTIRKAHIQERLRQGNIAPRSSPIDPNGMGLYLRIISDLY
ncbi:MAG: TonB-dependent receptor [Bacteroidetes bacterium]|nr:TonB-dependent receptor [Bacteroidota bacterium]MCY4204379.1 TonB-dependent receptor [Bacteroidota bacterium]